MSPAPSPQPPDLPTQLILTQPRQTLGSVQLADTPQPGSQITWAGQAYRVLERRHRYQYQGGRYQLSRVDVVVQAIAASGEIPDLATPADEAADQAGIGDLSCVYNARSPLLRCAVQPARNACTHCPDYQE